MSSNKTASVSQIPQLTISILEQEPYVTRTSGKYEGFLVDLIQKISEKAGFTYKFVQPRESSFGHKDPDNWFGVIGDVVNKRADIGGAPLAVTAERAEAVDFTRPYLSNSVSLLVQKPSWSDLGLGYLVRPISSEYWIMILVILLLIGIVFFLIGKFSPYEWGNVAAERDARGARNSFTLRNSYLFALSTITWQGYREAPHSLSGRIMAVFWWLFVLLTLIAYTSNLTAYLLARPEQLPEMPFQTYDELVESTSIHIGILRYGTTQKNLLNSHSTTHRSLWTKINAQNSWVESYEEGVRRVESSNGNFVMLMESASAEYFARKNCSVFVYGENIFATSMAFAVQKDSAWKNIIGDIILDLKTTGFIDDLKDKYWRFAGKCSNIDGRKFFKTGSHLSSLPIYPLTLKDMAVASLLFFVGLIAALLFLIIEVVHYAVTKKGKKIERPQVLKHRPKIFRPKNKAAKAGPADPEQAEPGPSSDGLESVPLDYQEDQGLSGEEGEKAEA
uniref:Ionotropic glutamate receptor C-terminal domain-containing protein n=1 Tax=Arion vulgaris TaxID=1028688 RepID=A0A0B7B4M7_9EUPU